MAANYSTLIIERLNGLDENEEQIRMDADYSWIRMDAVETERLDENDKNGLNFLRLVLMPLLFVLDSTMKQFGVGLMDVDKPMKRWFQASGDRLRKDKKLIQITENDSPSTIFMCSLYYFFIILSFLYICLHYLKFSLYVFTLS
jgi:hypothetical protein